MKNCILAVGLLSSLAAFGGLAGSDALSDHLWFFADFDSPALAGNGLFSAEFDPSGYRDGKFGRGYYFRRGAKNDLLPMAAFLADRANFTNAVNLVCAPGRLTLTAAGSFSVVPQPLRAGFSAARPRTGYAMSFYVKGAKGTKVTLTPSLGGVPEKTVREFVKKNPKFDRTKALKDEVGAVEYVLRGEGFERVCVTPVFDARLTAGRTVSLKVTASAKIEMERFQYQQVAVYPYHDIFLPTVWVDGGATVPETRLTLGDMDLVKSFPVRRGGFSVWFRRDETMPAYTNFPCNFWGCNPIYNNLRSANATDFVTDSYRSCVRLPSKRRLQADTAWHHAAGSWSDKGLFYYLDGELVASNVSDRIVFADPAAVGHGHSVYVGGGYAGSGGAEAILDELAVYSVDLGAADVRRLYEAKRGLLAGTKRLFGGEVEFTTFFRNDEGAALRPKVSAPADGAWRLEATVGGIRVASRMVALKRGANVIDIPFDPAKYAPGRYPFGWTLSAGGQVALARKGEVTICPRKDRDGFRIVSWGGFDPGEFASTMGFDTHVLWSSNPLGIRKVVNSGNFVNIRYENAREWRGVDCDFDAIERTSEAALSRWKGLYGWWGTLVCSEVYGIWNAISAREFPSYRRLAERQLGFKPKFSIGPHHPGNVDFAELGVKPPFKGVIGHDNAALETFRWFCDHGDPVVFSNARVKDAVHRLSPGNVVWTEPCCGTGGMFRELDGLADWYYSYSTLDVLGGLVATASPARRFNIRHQPTLTTWYGDNYGGPHPHRLGKDGKPELVRVSQTADELIVKSWMAIAASRADSLCFWNAGQWIKGIEGARALAASPTNEVKYVADLDAPAKYGAFVRERFLPAAELFKGVGNVRAPVALVSRAVTQYATHWGWGHYHYHRQLRSALIDVGLPVDQLGDLEFTPEILSQYRYLVLPMSFLAYDDEAAALKAAAEKGTVVVQDAEPAVRYPNDVCLTGLNYRVNRPVETCRPLLDWYTNRTEELRAMLPAWSSCDGKDGYTFVKEHKGVRYVTVVNDRRRDGGGLMTEIRTNATYRPYCAPQRVTTTLRGVPKDAKVYEFNAEGKDGKDERVGKDVRITRDFKAAEGVVYCVYPRALKAPELSTEGALKAGGKATLVVKIRDVGGKPAPGRQVVRLAFAAPGGELTDESGLYTVEDGVARIVLRFPYGAPTGTRLSGWKATVTDLTSGEEASLGFILEDEHRRRAAELVAQMTLEEKASQLLSDSAAIERLGIPHYNWWNEALHGVARAGLATVFPQNIGVGASFDIETEREVARAIAVEGRAKFNLFQKRGLTDWYCGLTFWSPNVNMFRDPRWGRGQETFGEDPHLSGKLGAAFVRGLQGDDPRFLMASACVKHYCVHSGPESGRGSFDSKVTARELREYYLPAFETVVREGRVESVMTAYNAVNGTPCTANAALVDGILRGEWGFDGHVVSDMSAVEGVYTRHKFAKTPVDTAIAAHSCGLDLCGGHISTNIVQAVREGRFPESRLDECLVHLFTARMRLGLFENPRPWSNLGAKDVATDAHHALAVRAAEKTLVLVKNDGVLPLDRAKVSQIGVAGPLALDEIALYGNYNGFSSRPSSLLSGLVEVAGPDVQVCHVKGCDMVGGPAVSAGAIGFAVARTQVAVVGVGITAELEGEDDSTVVGAGGGDRKSLGLPGKQMEFLRCVKSFGLPVVAVVFGGSSLDLKPVLELCDAVILAFYPGEGGGTAIARTIFGEANPAGRLPITYFKSLKDLPDQTDYHTAGHTYRYSDKEPILPFGFGLSYTTFAYDKARVERVEGAGYRVVCDVTNTGSRDGEEVVQAYVRAPAGTDTRRHHLEGFKRVAIRAGETKTIELLLGEKALSVYDENGGTHVPKGETTVFVGGGQPGRGDGITLTVRCE